MNNFSTLSSYKISFLKTNKYIGNFAADMRLSEKTLTWVLRLYPPFFFQRIWIRKFHKGFTGVDIKINKSILNRNSNGTIFGGTIFAATDPIYALLFGQSIRRKGIKPIVWLKSARIQYLKPARTSLYIAVRIKPEELQEAEDMLLTKGKFVRSMPIEILDKHGNVCAIAENEVYIRNLNFDVSLES